jgi:hypothetical protein
MSKEFTKFKEAQELTLFILYMALISSNCIFFALVEMGLIKSTSQEGSFFPIHYLGILPALAALYIHYKMKSPEALAKATLNQARKNQEEVEAYSEMENRLRFFYPNYVTRVILTLALAEQVTIFAMVAVLMGVASLTEFYTCFGVSMLLMGLMKPKAKDLIKEVEKILAREPY